MFSHFPIKISQINQYSLLSCTNFDMRILHLIEESHKNTFYEIVIQIFIMSEKEYQKNIRSVVKTNLF